MCCTVTKGMRAHYALMYWLLTSTGPFITEVHNRQTFSIHMHNTGLTTSPTEWRNGDPEILQSDEWYPPCLRLWGIPSNIFTHAHKFIYWPPQGGAQSFIFLLTREWWGTQSSVARAFIWILPTSHARAFRVPVHQNRNSTRDSVWPLYVQKLLSIPCVYPRPLRVYLLMLINLAALGFANESSEWRVYSNNRSYLHKHPQTWSLARDHVLSNDTMKKLDEPRAVELITRKFKLRSFLIFLSQGAIKTLRRNASIRGQLNGKVNKERGEINLTECGS